LPGKAISVWLREKEVWYYFPKQLFMTIWKRRPQERGGTCRFSGTFFVTQGVLAELSGPEIVGIYLDIQLLVKSTGGIDYFQVYENEKGQKLYFIDQCDLEMMVEESFNEEYNHCTLLFDHEY
jgi:hypothetical protein